VAKLLRKYSWIFPQIAMALIIMLWLNQFNAKYWPNFAQFLLPDSDDVARVMEVRNWLNGQGFYDFLLHRSNPPFGGQLHWSRLSDAPLALTQLILRPYFTAELAEKYAVFYTPLWLCTICAIIAGFAARQIYKSWLSYFIGVYYVAFTDTLAVDFAAGRVDHHGLQKIFYFTMFLGLFRGDYKGGIIGGLALAASLTIGFEMLPLQVIVVLVLAIIWVLNPNRSAQLKGLAQALGFGILIGFFINVAPQNYFIGDNDRLSIAQTMPIIFGCISLWLGVHFSQSKDLKTRALCLGGAGAITIIAALPFPILIKPLYWQIAPIFNQLWMNDVGETFPIWRFPMVMQYTIMALLVLAMIAGLIKQFLLWRENDPSKKQEVENWAMLNAAMVLSVFLSAFFQVRIHTQSAALALLVCAPIIAQVFLQKNHLKGIIYGALIALILSPWAILKAKTIIMDNKPKALQKAGITFGGRFNCREKRDFAHLANLPKGLVATNISLGAEMLFMTPHDVLSTHFHRDLGRDAAYDIYLSTPDKALERIKAHKVDYIAYCNRAMEYSRIYQYYPNSLMGQLRLKKIPDYLEPIPRGDHSDIEAYRVKK
jgi:hypothetical protein